ncbi:MAG: SDR family oxidoreductase [Nitrososphaeraceae archaeon]|nr:SDR family oxidoreductase [Nitrososphaeraceae archaeon]MDW3667198.1 SDR family oxidoreductase [Nitrososphaeraceae archaeon]
MSTIYTALVTGSGRGIGKETAILLSKKGFNLIICSRNQNEIDSVVKEIKSFGNDRILARECDVSVSSQVNRVVNEALDIYGRIDVLINNAGISYVKKLIDTTEEEWDNTLDINLKGSYLFAKAIVPHMIKHNYGIIINVSSGAGKIGFEDISAYCASKFGMIGLTESLAREINNYNIRVMTICPGQVATKMQKDIDSQYYELNKNKMLHPRKVAEKIADMIFSDKEYPNGVSVDLRS